MPSFDEALTALLEADAPLAALVGTRIYLEVAGQDATLPYLTRVEISAVPDNVLAGRPSFTRRRVQFTAWGESAASANAVREALKDCLAGFRGEVDLGGSPPQTYRIQAALPDTETAIADPNPQAPRSFGRAVDFIFHVGF